MENTNNLSDNDYKTGLQHLWLPYTQMLHHKPPLYAKKTAGTHITLENGDVLIDGIASWWAACHGYNPKPITDAVIQQFQVMPHIMFGGFVHKPALQLACRLCQLLGEDLNRVFFTESGSVSVEVAMKMAVQRQLNKKQYQRTKILCFYGGYHGDTFATMSVCDPQEGMHHLFHNALIQQIIAPLPTTEQKKQQCQELIEKHQNELAAIIIEPFIQGAGGMLFSTGHVLEFLRRMADDYDLTLIFDEIFTGFWRTGHEFAFKKTHVKPDIITLSKSLTGGTVPLAATIATEKIFEDFLSLNEEHALMHGPTFMANPVACAAANASLDMFACKNMPKIMKNLSARLKEGLEPCLDNKNVKDVRIMGGVGVVELYPPVNCDEYCRIFAHLGAWIRPFRNIIYLTPAFIMSDEEIHFLTSTIRHVIEQYAHR